MAEHIGLDLSVWSSGTLNMTRIIELCGLDSLGWAQGNDFGTFIDQNDTNATHITESNVKILYFPVKSFYQNSKQKYYTRFPDNHSQLFCVLAHVCT